MNKTRTLMSSLATVCLTTVFVPAAFAATTTAATTTAAQPTAQQATAAAAKWMLTNQLTKMQDWTLVSTFAGMGGFQSGTWSNADLAKLTAGTDYARTILGMLGAGQDPHNYNGQSLVQALAKTQLASGSNEGKFADNIDGTGTDLINNQCWAIIALEDAGGAPYNRASAGMWLIAHQNKDGGFGNSSQYNSSDPDDTAAAVVALSLLGYTAQSQAVSSALAYLKAQQAADGGFGFAGASNADSTGVVMDALEAVGENPTTWTQKTANPELALLSFYDATSGGFKVDNGGESWAGVGGLSTRDALIGLAAVNSGKSVYQRLHWNRLNTLNDYWTHIYEEGGAYSYHQWKSWGELRPMAIAGTYLSSLTPSWQAVVKAHGKYVQHGKTRTWEAWDATLAKQALIASFGLDSVHLNQI